MALSPEQCRLHGPRRAAQAAVGELTPDQTVLPFQISSTMSLTWRGIQGSHPVSTFLVLAHQASSERWTSGTPALLEPPVSSIARDSFDVNRIVSVSPAGYSTCSLPRCRNWRTHPSSQSLVHALSTRAFPGRRQSHVARWCGMQASPSSCQS